MLDIILVAVVVLAAVWGFSRGMVKVLFSLAGYVVAFLVSKAYAGKLVAWIDGAGGWQSSLGESINENLSQMAGGATMEAIPSDQSAALSQMQNLGFDLEEMLQGGLSSLADSLAYFVMLALASIFLFFVVKLLMSLLGKVIRGILRKSSLLSTTDRLVGLGVGLLLGAGLVVFFVGVASPLALGLGNSTFIEALSNSTLASLILESDLYQTNLEQMLLSLSQLSQGAGGL